MQLAYHNKDNRSWDKRKLMIMPTIFKRYIWKLFRCWVSGWGKTAFASDETPTYKQKQVQVPIVPSDVCYASMSSLQLLGSNVNKYLDPFGEICAGGETAKDACTVSKLFTIFAAKTTRRTFLLGKFAKSCYFNQTVVIC